LYLLILGIFTTKGTKNNNNNQQHHNHDDDDDNDYAGGDWS